MVDGKIVMEHREVKTIDEREVIARIKELSRGVEARSGVTPPTRAGPSCRGGGARGAGQHSCYEDSGKETTENWRWSLQRRPIELTEFTGAISLRAAPAFGPLWPLTGRAPFASLDVVAGPR